jgi:hypothetical protein
MQVQQHFIQVAHQLDFNLPQLRQVLLERTQMELARI